MVGSAALQLKVDYEQIKQLPTGTAVHSDVFSAGGHSWRIDCYPHGSDKSDTGECFSIFVRHMSKTRRVKAIVEAFLMDRNGEPCKSFTKRSCVHDFSINNVGDDKNCSGDDDDDDGDNWGWSKFVDRATLEKYYVTFGCTVMVLDDGSIPVPPSDIGIHLGSVLDRNDGTDVSFIVEVETFRAHRVVLAARSPVFRAELFGSMAEATLTSITLHDITPKIFKVMLRFLYTDELPAEIELGDSSSEMFQNLVIAADCYALDRLKIICAKKLWDNVSIDTVSTTLACAETYNCPQLKNNCIDFLLLEENFKEAALTKGFALLVLKFPLIIAELKNRVRTYHSTPSVL
uniref:Speckle-type POZ protein-like protein n=3 Tax=Triticinae TaxID=1648030 RepID=M8BY13_AEGTA|nr:BTB/POZ and MATH domain-containing protein 1-like [Aegilops tauschii subsp. strangulata]